MTKFSSLPSPKVGKKLQLLVRPIVQINVLQMLTLHVLMKGYSYNFRINHLRESISGFVVVHDKHKECRTTIFTVMEFQMIKQLQIEGLVRSQNEHHLWYCE